MSLLDTAKSYAAADGDGRIIQLPHFVLAIYSARRVAGQLLAAAGFVSELPVPLDYRGADTFRLAPELGRNLDWVSGLRLGLGEEVDFAGCFLLGCFIGPMSLEGWLRHRGVDCDCLCRALVESLGLPDSACSARVRWSTVSLRLPVDEAEAVMRDLRSRGRRFMVNKHDDGTVTLVPEDGPSRR